MATARSSWPSTARPHTRATTGRRRPASAWRRAGRRAGELREQLLALLRARPGGDHRRAGGEDRLMGVPLFGQEHVDGYRDTDGEEDHDWQGTTVLLLTTTGRNSGAK